MLMDSSLSPHDMQKNRSFFHKSMKIRTVVQLGPLNIFFSGMEPSQICLVVAVAAILFFHHNCIMYFSSYHLEHTCQHRKDDVYSYDLMIRDYGDTTYDIINCSGEQSRVNSVT